MGKLTNTAVKAAAPGKYEDGQGLRMVVTKTGSRKWALRYQLQGRRREMGLGSYPAVSLKLARDKGDGHSRDKGDGHFIKDPLRNPEFAKQGRQQV